MLSEENVFGPAILVPFDVPEVAERLTRWEERVWLLLLLLLSLFLAGGSALDVALVVDGVTCCCIC